MQVRGYLTSMQNIESNSPVSPAELQAFVDALSAAHNAAGREAYPTGDLNWGTVIAEPGRKYARLVLAYGNSGSRSAMGFINLTNGDILKSDGWKAPAKHARGNIRVGNADNCWNGAFTKSSGLHVSYLR